MPVPTILLVDDVDFFLEMGKDFLKNTAANIHTARNGREALEVAEKVSPDLVYMDVTMPVMDGLTCCKIFKKDPRFRKVPVIMVFAPSKELTVESCRETGCDGVLTKPIDRKAFLEMGRRFLYQVERREKRVPCQMTVDFKLSGSRHQGMGVDLSEHGMYIQFREMVAVNQKFDLSFYLPMISPQQIEARARVAWVNQGFPRPNLGYPQGFGVEFVNMEPVMASVVREYVARESVEKSA